MEITSLCIRLLVNLLLLIAAQHTHCAQRADAAFPHIEPPRLQFFEYESIFLSCSGFRGPTEWRVIKRIHSNTTPWENSTGSMTFKPAYISYSGEYWCENGEGERSNTLNIIVTAGVVILESPALPVMEGQSISLRCRKKAPPYLLTADFYKDGLLKDTGYKGKMTIHNVSKSNEGLYKCKIIGAGESPESWLAVRAVLLSVVGILQCRKHREYELAGVAEPLSDTYANVTKHKKKKGCQESVMSDVTYAVVTIKKKKRGNQQQKIASSQQTAYE
uniref:low affinity immunoglobulin gamma Fc region receptor III-A-like n=1 Tax=Semicossyphus pulcher TaxID=241346 RepID=UPI0037E82D45